MTITKHAVRRGKQRGYIPRTASKRRAIKYIHKAIDGAKRYRKGVQWVYVADEFRAVVEGNRVITVI